MSCVVRLRPFLFLASTDAIKILIMFLQVETLHLDF
jgi:hypothetical protein